MLNDDQQIQTLEMLEDGLLPGWSSTEQQIWFATLRFHTLLGFAAAPRFGGNQNLAGWRAMNFPGHIHEMGGLSDAQVEGAEPITLHFPH
jgi:gluconate 2-dehydrogenase gamma chain